MSSVPTADRGVRLEAFQRSHRTGLVTLLFTDMVDSTALKQKLGDRAAATLFEKHHQLIRDTLQRFAGAQEIETAGDSFLIVFATPSDAVQFALMVQVALHELSGKTQAPLQDRIGIHVGEVVIKSGQASAKPTDLYGIQIDTCARVMSLANAGQILMTRAVFDSARQVLKGEDIESVGPLEWLNHGPYQLKGLDEPVEICQVREAGRGIDGPPTTSDKARRCVDASNEQVLGWRPAIGQLVPNTRWQLEQKLGEGGFGEVWLGRHQTMKERRVFKFCFRADHVRFLKRELTLFRLLKERVGDHPHIVRLLEVYFDESPFYVEMDYVEGKDLKSWSDSQGGLDKVPLPVRLEIAAQIADALQAAHDAGVIHRDIKPSNILISGVLPDPAASPARSDGEPAISVPVVAKLTDFGIGQVVSAEYLEDFTRTGFTRTIMAESSSSHSGTQLYMAPELLAGKPASPRSDIFSLGVVLYQMLLGDFTRPLTADWADAISDPLLREDLKLCFAGNPEDRFAGATQLAKNLRNLPQRQADLAAQHAREAARERAAYRRGLVRATSLATVIVLGIATLAVTATWQRNRARAQELMNRRLLYAAEINVAAHALLDGNIFRASELLQAQRPQPNSEDMRGFEWRFLWQLCQSDEVTTLKSGRAYAQSIAISPDGRLLAAGNAEVGIQLWDLATRREPISVLSAAGYLRSVVFSSNGKLIASGVYQRKVQLWDVAAGKELVAFETPDPVERVALSPDGKWLAASLVGEAGAALWNLETQQLAGNFRGPPSTRPCVDFSPDSQILAYGLGDKTVRLVQIPSGRELSVLRGHQNIVTFVKFSPDGKSLATASADTTVKLWDLSEAREIATLRAHQAHVTSVAFSPDGRMLASSDSDWTIRLWDVPAQTEIRTLLGHRDWVSQIVFSPNGELLASCSDDGLIKLWDARPQASKIFHWAETNLTLYAKISADRKCLLRIGTDNSVELIDALRHTSKAILRPASNVGVAALRPRTADSSNLRDANQFDFDSYAAVFSRDNQGVAVVLEDGTVHIFDAATGRQTSTWKTGAQTGIRQAVLSADARRLAVLSGTSQVSLWEVSTGQNLGTLTGAGFDLLLDPPDGRILAARKVKAGFELWDAATQTRVASFAADEGMLGCLIATDDFKRLARSVYGKRVWVWDFATGKPITQLIPQRGGVTCLRFSPDGNILASGSDDHTIRLWDIENRREIATLRGYSGWVRGLDFSHDGKTLASVGNRGSAKLWGLSSLRELLTLPGRVAPYSQIVFTADDQGLVCLGEDKTLRFWRAPSSAEINRADHLQIERP